MSEIFEARKPENKAIVAEISGRVELMQGKFRNKHMVKVINDAIVDEEGNPQVREHVIPPKCPLRVRTGDYVNAGEPLVEGPLDPHDILKVSGVEKVQEYLTREVQKVYRAQNVSINDKHIEIIVSQMLRKIMVEDGGDTGLLEGSILDKFDFAAKNKALETCVKITDCGDTNFTEGEIVPRDYVEARNAEVQAAGLKAAQFVNPKPATGSIQLLGISKAAVQSPSFISAASFQETTKVLTEAALAGKVDHLVGLKENVILGHLIPAGTGFKAYQNAEWGKNANAVAEGDDAMTLDSLVPDDASAPASDYALLNDTATLESLGIFDGSSEENFEDDANYEGEPDTMEDDE